MGVNARIYPYLNAYICRHTENPTFADKMSRMIHIINCHVHRTLCKADPCKWNKLYSELWWKFDKSQRKISSIYNICSGDFNAKEYYNALCKYVKENESKLN